MERLSLPLSASPSSITSTATKQTTQMETCKLYPFICDTYRYIRRGCAGLKKDFFNNHLIEIINKYKVGCNKIYEDAFKSRGMSLKLAQNIVRTIDLFKDMCTTYTHMEEYQLRICELLAIYIACELRLGVDSTAEEQFHIGNRIIYIIRKHLVQANDETRYNILRTLVYIPRFFNAREIVCAIFKELIPIKPVMQVNVFPDKLYILYIIVFYRWMKMENNIDAKEEILNFAESFMKPSATLASNKLYAVHLPLYKTYSRATRSILNNFNYYKGLKNASTIDNAFKKTGTIVNLCDDEDDDVILEDATKISKICELFPSMQLKSLDGSFNSIKFEETTVVNTVALTVDEEVDCETSVLEKHNKWLNGFQQTAKQLRDSQIIKEHQQTIETPKVICLDSDSESEEVEKEENIGGNNKCAADSALRTYHIKNNKKTTTERDIKSQTPKSNRSTTESDIKFAYRQDSIHISSTPLQKSGNDVDNCTDVQYEKTGDPFLPTPSKNSFLSASSITGSTLTAASTYSSSPLKQLQKEHIGQNSNTNKLEIKQHGKINHNERLNFDKNLQVFNKNFLNIKNNFKIKLCKVNLNRRSISLYNGKSSNIFEKIQPSGTDNSSSEVIKQTETCQLQTNIHNYNSNNKFDDNSISKKLWTIKEMRKFQKCPAKPKVVFNNKKQIHKKNIKLITKNKKNKCDVPLNKETISSMKMKQIDLRKKKNNSKNKKSHTDLEMDSLLEIRKLLADEINRTFEKVRKTDNNTKTSSITHEVNVNSDKNSVATKDNLNVHMTIKDQNSTVNADTKNKAVEIKYTLSKEKTETTPKLLSNFSAEFLAGLNDTNITQHDSQTEKKIPKSEVNVCVKEENIKKIKSPQDKEYKTLTSHISALSGVNDNIRSEIFSKVLNDNAEPMRLVNDYKNKEFKEIQDDEEKEQEIVDAMEISYDSNSACSLPLKKRTTPSDTNDNTEKSQHIVVTNFKHTQDIAAEIIIKNNKELEKNTNIRAEELISLEECRSKAIHYELNDKPSTSAACFKNKSEASTPIKIHVNSPARPIGQPPIQIVAPQLKNNSPSPFHEHRSAESQAYVAPLLHFQPWLESYPATPMLGVASIEILMDFNRFIEDLLASRSVMTIIDNANACGYYAEGQVYKLELIAILEHYNITNVKSNKTPLYWTKSGGNTISIFNDNEWISLPHSTASQLLKLSFALSILQQQYNINDVRKRIHLALTFLIHTTYTSKLQPTTTVITLEQHSRTNNFNLNNTQTLPSAQNFRIATNNNDSLNTNFSMNSNIESVQDLHLQNFSNTLQLDNIQSHTQQHHHQHNRSLKSVRQQQQESMQQGSLISINQNLNNNCQQQSEMYNTTTNNADKTEHLLVENHKKNSWENPTNDQLNIYPPCATTPQNEVIVNTNGVQPHDIPKNFQDQLNILISITDDTASSSESIHKYNARQQQNRTLETNNYREESGLSSATYANRPCLPNTNVNTALFQNQFTATSRSNIPRNIISAFGNQEIDLKNCYRMKQTQQQQHSTQTNASSYNMPHNNINFMPLSQQQLLHHHIPPRYSCSNVSSRNMSPPTQTKQNGSTYKDILQTYITYLIKDHEKTSKHLLEIFEEVSNINSQQQTANTNSTNVTNNSLTSTQQQRVMLSPLIRNLHENDMPTTGNTTILPSLIKNPQHRDSGALQQSYENTPQKQIVLTNPMVTAEQQSIKTIHNLGFAKEYVNFAASRDEVLQKLKLRIYKMKKLNDKKNVMQQQQQLQQQLQERQQQPHLTELPRLNSNKRKCQERNDKITEVLKHKIAELTLLKNNVHIKLLDKEQQQAGTCNKNTTATTSRRGRPKKSNSKDSLACEPPHFKIKQTNNSSCKSNNTDLPPAASQTKEKRSAAREANKRIIVCNKQFSV